MQLLSIRSLLLFIIVVIGAGCSARDVAYRHPPTPSEEWEACSSSTTCSKSASVELRTYQTEDGARGDYLMSYVEFDDQGWFQDMAQRNALFEAVQNYRKRNQDTQFLIVAYAHGWKHNASGQPEDPDVTQFSKLLERLDVLEQSLMNSGKKEKARKVVGVYLGWRGASIQIPYLENLTFWTRKNTGERVGDHSAKQLLVELNEFRASLNCWSKSDRLANSNETQLILIGHSFGGMLMYHALHTELIERALHLEMRKDEKRDERGAYRYATAKSFGDFILLVNPAFEGSAYESLFHAAKSRRIYTKDQRPVMAIVTSKSDQATKLAFPIGRFYTYTQSAPHEGERDTVRRTVGHLPRYITHELHYRSDVGTTEVKREGLSPTTKEHAEQTVGELLRNQLRDVEKTGYTLNEVQVMPAPHEDLPKNFPYLVMSADKEIIDGHNDIWNDRFVNFVEAFIAQEIMAKKKNAAGKNTKKTCDLFPFWRPEATAQ